MPSLHDSISQLLEGAHSRQISAALGVGEDETRSAITAALPTLLGALARNSEEPGGAESLHRALENDHDGGLLDDLSGFLERADFADGSGILRHALGARQPAVERGVSQTSGLDPATVGKLLTMLAPVVMGMLGRTRQQEGLDVSSLTELLAGERRQVERPGSAAIDIVSMLLDSDKDGSVGDDLGKIGKSFLGGLLRRRK